MGEQKLCNDLILLLDRNNINRTYMDEEINFQTKANAWFMLSKLLRSCTAVIVQG